MATARDYRVNDDGRTQKNVNGKWLTVSRDSAENIKQKYGVGADGVKADSRSHIDQMRDRAKSAPKASVEEYTNRMNNGVDIGKLTREEADRKISDYGGQTLGPQPTAIAPATAQFDWWNQINQDAIAAVNAQIAAETEAIQDMLENNQMLTKQQIDALEAQRDENVAKMQSIGNQNNFRIAENENRFGGTYSGGLRLQQAANDESINEGIGNINRDTQTRSSNLWSQYGQLAQQAYDKIANLSKQTPAMVQDYITRALQNAGAYGALTGQLPGGGGQTFAAQQANRNFALNESGVTGQYNGSPTMQAQNQMFNQQMDLNRFNYGMYQDERNFNYQTERDARKDYESDRLYEYQSYRDNVNDQKWAQEFEQSVKARAEDMGYKWASLNQREKELLANQQAREYEMALNQMDTDFNRGLDIYNSTGQMPSYMTDYGVNVQALNSGQGDIKAEVEGLYTELVNGNVTPEQALQRLNDAEKLGLKDSTTINELRKTIYLLAPETDPAVQQQQEEERKQRQSTRNEGISEIITPSLTLNPVTLFKERQAQLKKIFGG